MYVLSFGKTFHSRDKKNGDKWQEYNANISKKIIYLYIILLLFHPGIQGVFRI